MQEPKVVGKVKPESRAILEGAGFEWDPASNGWRTPDGRRVVSFDTVRDFEDQGPDRVKEYVEVLELLSELQCVPVPQLLDRVQMDQARLRAVLRAIEKNRLGAFSTNIVDNVELFTLHQPYWREE